MNCLPSLWPPPPLPPFQSQCTVNRQCVAVGVGRWGVLSCVVDHHLQNCYTSVTPNTQVKTTFRDCCPYSSFVHVYNAELTRRYRSCCAWSSWLLTSTSAVPDWAWGLSSAATPSPPSYITFTGKRDFFLNSYLCQIPGSGSTFFSCCLIRGAVILTPGSGSSRSINYEHFVPNENNVFSNTVR